MCCYAWASSQFGNLIFFRNLTAELENIHPIHPSIRETAFSDGWDRWMDKFEFSYKIPGEINASMPQKPLTCLPREFVMWLSCSRPNSSACFFRVMLTVRAASGFVGVIVAPDTVNGVQIGRGNGAVRFQTDISFRAQEQQHIIRIPSCLFTVVLGTAAFGKAVVIRYQPTQTFRAPKENAFDLRYQLVRKKRVILSVNGFLLDRQDKLSAVKPSEWS